MNPKRSKLKSVALANLMLFLCITIGIGYTQNITAQTADDEVVEDIAQDSDAVQDAVLEAYGLEEEKPAVEETAEEVVTEEPAVEETAEEVVTEEPAVEETAEEVVTEEPAVKEATEEVVVEEPVVAEKVVEIKPELTPLEKNEIARRKANKAAGMAHIKAGEQAAADQDYETAVNEYGKARVELEKVSKLDPEVQLTLEKVAKARAQIYEEWASKLVSEARQNESVAKYDSAINKLKQAKAFNTSKSDQYQARIEQIEKKLKSAYYIKSIKAGTIDSKKEQRDLDEKTFIEQGKLHFRNRRFEEAKEAFSNVRRINPYNETALEYLTRVEDEIVKVGKKAREVAVRERISATTWAWVPALPKIDDALDTNPSEPIIKQDRDPYFEKMQDKLENIIIRKLELDEATIQDVVKLLIEKSEIYDQKYKEGVNIILDLATKSTPASGSDDDFGDEGDDFGDEGDDFGDEGDDFGDEGTEDDGFDDAGFDDEPAAPVATATGTITATFKDMPLGEVIKYVCNAAALQWRADKHAIVIATELKVNVDVKTRFFSVRPGFVQAILAGVQGDTAGSTDDYDDYEDEGDSAQVVNASAESLKKGFKALGVEFLKGTEVSYNSHISKLVITQTEEALNKIQQLINEMDTGRPLVNITAKFVEVGQTDMNELGFEWMITDQKTFGSGNGSMAIEGTPASPIDITSGLNQLSDFLQPNQLAATAGDVFSSYLTIGNIEFANVIRALDKQQNVDILSSPEVTTLSGEEAIIKSVTKRYFPTSWTEPEAGSGSGGGIIQLEGGGSQAVTNSTPSIPEFDEQTELGVVLTVTPTVTVGSKEIELVLNPQVTAFIEYDEAIQIPFPGAVNGTYSPKMAIIEERSLQTRVICDNGETVVLGGLMKEKVTSYSDRVPLLASIPLIGKLFQAEGEHTEKANLLVFVTARLVDSAGREIGRSTDERTGNRGLPTFDF